MDSCVWIDVETGNDEVEAGFRVLGFGFGLGEIGQFDRGLYCVCYIK